MEKEGDKEVCSHKMRWSKTMALIVLKLSVLVYLAFFIVAAFTNTVPLDKSPVLRKLYPGLFQVKSKVFHKPVKKKSTPFRRGSDFWQEVKSPIDRNHSKHSSLFAVNFFYDDRDKHMGVNQVVGFVSSVSPDLQVFCVFWVNKSADEILQLDMVQKATLINLRTTRYLFRGVHYVALYLTCQSPQRPDWLSLSFTKPSSRLRPENISNLFPVISPEKPGMPVDQSKKIGICTDGMHGEFEDREVPLFIQWVELSNMFGASFISLYNITLLKYSQYLPKLIDYYTERGMLEYIQFPPIPPTRPPYHGDTEVEMAKQTLVRHTVGDCMYRHLHQYWYVLYIDMDEIVFPRCGAGSYAACISHYLTRFSRLPAVYSALSTSSSPHCINTTKYVDARYMIHNPVLRYNSRLKHTNPSKLNKVFTNPRLCDYLYEHGCLDQAAMIAHMPPKDMLTHRYRLKNQPCNDNDTNLEIIGDLFLRYYSEEITSRTEAVLKAIGWKRE